MAKIQNKEIIQSYILTTAKYDFSVYEKRILYRIIELNQNLIEGKKLNEKYIVDSNNQGDITYTLPISLFLKDDDKSNHKEVKKALENLKKKELTYEDDKIWASLSIIANPKIMKYSEKVTFTIDKMINDALINFSKGFKKYELKVAMEFESTYSMRFYELFSHQKTPINYSIDDLKEMFKVSDKYKLTANFINKVIVPAKKELDKSSPYTFSYDQIKTGRKITGIRFIPIYQPQFEDDEIKKQRLNKQISNRWFIPKNVEDYLKYNFDYTDKELKNNLNLFENLYNNLSEESLLDFLSELREPSAYATNRKAFIIGALKKKMEQIVEEKYLNK
ncbi:replication initiation protein [Empedobacter stercoris]|uniref:replication initiation protein n=1 Tax=Empedobacter stercoris TaxID=1628248 RepID=UPI00166249D1|nr:replication initiation protein [Empedobacter stercoris]MCA4810619.1 replication initiation protein [Empedobacter stercoris]QNT15727.1 replication initiation protein [Empedobacter stercoris]